jgi:hydrogenase maturation protease
MTITIIGIGQSLRSDDGAGLAAVRAWMVAYPVTASDPRLRVELVELPGLALLDLLADSHAAIITDAVHSGAAPGTLHRLELDDLAGFEPGSSSAHGWGVAETLQLGRLLNPDSLPEEIILLGIEAGDLNLGEVLSEAVQNAFPVVIEKIEAQVRGWLD